jgi:glycosyltransferase involved in cell wall biosynthesis
VSARIVIDGYNLGLEHGTGIATYARNLSYQCHAIGLATEILYGTRAALSLNPLLREIAFFDPHVGAPRWLEILRHVARTVTAPFAISRAVKVPITGTVITKTYASRLPYFDTVWNAPDVYEIAHHRFAVTSQFSRVKGLHAPDIMHWTYPVPLTVPGARNIYTLHDLVPLRLPYTTLDNKRRYHKMLAKIVRRAHHIVTVSENSRRDIINLLGCPEHKITNTYQAVDIPKKYADKPDDVVQREVEGAFGVKYKRYYLFFGAIEPKKNIGRLIEAYLSSQIEDPLVMIGAMAWKSEQELRLLNETSNRYLEQIDNLTFLRDRIRRFDYAPFPLLVSAIKGAKAVVFPSLYEGFGLPALESMLLGTPVITSKESCLPEVVGDAALMVDPYDTRELAQAIRSLDASEPLRRELAARGVKQAALYSPDRYRERLDEMYTRLLGQDLPRPRSAQQPARAATQGKKQDAFEPQSLAPASRLHLRPHAGHQKGHLGSA